MKKIFVTLVVLLSGGIANAQAYKGEGDLKFQIGSNIQKGAAGLSSSIDYGFGENMSIGAQASFILNNAKYNDKDGRDAKFLDKVDVKVRFNANLGNVLKLDSKMDIYPGLHIGMRNLGLHGGFRYFFTDGFGLYAEGGFPIASFDNRDGYNRFNNQFVGNVGLSFNL
jgi:hypothetical protein